MFYFPLVPAFIIITSPSSICQYPALHPGRYASILFLTSFTTRRDLIYFITDTVTLFQSLSCRHRVTGQTLEVNSETQVGINFHHPGKDHPILCKLAITTMRNNIKCLDSMEIPLYALGFSNTKEHLKITEHDSILLLLKLETVPMMADCCRIQPFLKSRRHSVLSTQWGTI